MSRSNQLPTLSKEAKWGNEQDPEFTECELCKTGETEHQVHALLLCKHARKFHRTAALKIREYLLSKVKQQVSIPRIELWGIPFTINQNGIIQRDLSEYNEWSIREQYFGLTGLIPEKYSKLYFNETYFKSPYRVIKKVNNIIVTCAKEIWTSRNLIHNVNKNK